MGDGGHRGGRSHAQQPPLARVSVGRHPPKPSTTIYCRSNKPVLHPLVEPGQYTSFKLAEHLDAAGIAASIGSVGDAYDNALMESTIVLFKTELIKPRQPWKTLSEVELATAERVDRYNRRRLHGEMGHALPVEHEANYYPGLTKPQVTTTV